MPKKGVFEMLSYANKGFILILSYNYGILVMSYDYFRTMLYNKIAETNFLFHLTTF